MEKQHRANVTYESKSGLFSSKSCYLQANCTGLLSSLCKPGRVGGHLSKAAVVYSMKLWVPAWRDKEPPRDREHGDHTWDYGGSSPFYSNRPIMPGTLWVLH